MTKDAKNLIVGLDIGTSKIVAVVAEVMPDGRHEVIGLGQHESKGLKKGVVVNIEATVESIQRALEEAELMADCKISRVYTGIAGSHIRSFNSSGMVAIKDKEVTAADVSRVIETAKAVNIPTDQQLLHTLPQEFIVDSQDDVREPIGMSGIRLEVKVHIVTGAVSAVQNIVKCVRRCGLEVSDLILQPMASAEAVLTRDEKELGVVVIDGYTLILCILILAFTFGERPFVTNFLFNTMGFIFYLAIAIIQFTTWLDPAQVRRYREEHGVSPTWEKPPFPIYQAILALFLGFFLLLDAIHSLVYIIMNVEDTGLETGSPVDQDQSFLQSKLEVTEPNNQSSNGDLTQRSRNSTSNLKLHP